MGKGTHEDERVFTFSTYGNSFSKGVAHTSAAFSIFIIIISIVYGLGDGFSIREVLDEVGIFFLYSTSVGLFAYQHKAKITRDINSFNVIFRKQFTPLIVYSRRELDIKKISLKQSRKYVSNESGSGSYQYTTKIYYNGSEIFSCKEHKSEFKEILPELFKTSLQDSKTTD
jgi:hypothetical protein|tara:strand:+ start:88 stop:600 length:513 start_codon:yes stop_codon:yes gene_type:complete